MLSKEDNPKKVAECKKHEFNCGFVSALALFYGHVSQFQDAAKLLKQDLRVYGASDHLADLEIPTAFRKTHRKLATRIDKFVRDVWKDRLANITVDDAQKHFTECEAILLEIDRALGLEHVCANFP